MRPRTTYNNSGKSSYANFEIGPDLNKPYVQVVKQQVKMHKDEPSVDEQILTIATKRELSRRSTQHGKHTTHEQDMMHNKHDASPSYMKLLMARDDANKSNTSRQV